MSVDVSQYHRTGQLQGHCLCRAVTITIDGAHTAAIGACHCVMCRRWSGTVYSAFAAKADAVTVDGDVRRYASSAFSERAFCPECGSHLWLRNTPDGDEFEFMPGLFEEAHAFPLVSEIYVDRAPGYARLSGDHATATRADYEARAPFVEGDDP